jgi:hypothetical protein
VPSASMRMTPPAASTTAGLRQLLCFKMSPLDA